MDESSLSPLQLAGQWLRELEGRLLSGVGLAEIFVSGAHWRDAVAFTGSLLTTSGATEIESALQVENSRVKSKNFTVSLDPAPQLKTRGGVEIVEAFFDFVTDAGTGRGVVRLMQEEGMPIAWTLLTALQTMEGFEDPDNSNRPRGGKNASNLAVSPGEAIELEDPEVVIIGGGHAGMMLGARLKRLGVEALIVDKNKRVGDNWRLRYDALALHNEAWVCELPYMSYPPTWPVYLPKDMLANWLETYAWAMELNYWTNSELVSAVYDSDAKRWIAILQRDGEVRELRPRHLVIATGLSGGAKNVGLPGLGEFEGTVMHSSVFSNGNSWKGKQAIVVGSGNSGHDVAQELHERGAASVTMVQRSPTTITSVEPAAQLVFALYSEGPSISDSDLLAVSMSYDLTLAGQKILTKRMYELDKHLLDRLEERGFRTDLGEDDSGYYMKYLRTGGGYYLNVGCSELIADGKIHVAQSSSIERYCASGAVLTDGTIIEADLILMATGYENLQDTTRRVLGDEIADTVGPVWGFDVRGDVNNMWRETDQEGLWYMAGSFAQCRTYSRYLAQQLKVSLDAQH